MLYKDFGQTGKKVSVIGFGGMRYRIEDHIDGNFDKCSQLIIRAHELGINYFDTAPEYCEDHSEAILGHAIKQLKAAGKQLPYISTKVNLHYAHDADSAQRMIEQSLTRLNVDKITFYNMWCIKNLGEYKEYIKPNGIYDGILRAKNEGLIEHICCSCHMDGEDIAEVVSDGRVEAVTLGYNALNFAYRRKGVKAAAKAGIGVVTMNPLGGGMIPRHPELFGFLSKNSGGNVAQSAIRFLLGQKEISVALLGMFSIEQIEDNVNALDSSIQEITDTDLNNMSAALSERLNVLCTLCSYCDKCPVNIPIPKLLDCYNELIVTGEKRFAKRRLKEYWHIDAATIPDCIECGNCETLCTQKLPIIERLKIMKSIFEEELV
ncbi:MAG: aldo/keto reductase [Termitinemataceae bacterium]|nr:MAG: aldo/keto reductase [Termitinemataceae bacterium]